MPNLEDFLVLRKRYMESAEFLFEAGHYEIAYYLAGYSVEFTIKAVICKKTGPHEYPPDKVGNTHYTHLIEKLIETAKLKKEFDYEKEKSPDFNKSFMVLKDWDPKDIRYDSNPIGQEKAKDYIDEIKNEKGFIVWLNKYL